jgi:hypothetical protein
MMTPNDSTYGSPGPDAEIVHLCPHEGRAVTPCCARLVLELPRYHRLTVDPKLVTCGA